MTARPMARPGVLRLKGLVNVDVYCFQHMRIVPSALCEESHSNRYAPASKAVPARAARPGGPRPLVCDAAGYSSAGLVGAADARAVDATLTSKKEGQ